PQTRVAMARFYMLQHKKDRAEQVLADAKKTMPDNPDGYRLLGDFYFSTGETDKALAEYAALLQEHKNDLKLKKTYIATLLLRNRVDEAARLNDEILNKDPQDVEALVARGRILVAQRKGDEAVQALEKAVKSDPDNAAAHYYLALAADLTGDANRREQELREAVRLRSDFLEAQTALAAVALRKRDWDTLRTSAEVVLKSQPSSPQGYIMRGMAEIGGKDIARGEADFKQAIQVAPQNPSGYIRLGELRLAQGRFKETDQLLEQALNLDPNSAESMQLLLTSNFAQRQPPSRMIARINAQLSKSPNNSSYYGMLGGLEAQMRDFASAEKHLNKALELDKNNLMAFGLLAQVQVSAGSADKAVATYQNWIQQNPKDVRPYVLLGSVEEMRNNWQQAQKMYQKALEVSPDYPVAANNLAYSMLEHGGNIDTALSLAQVARRGMQESPSAADTLAWAYYHKGAYGLAVDLLQDAIKRSPDNPTYQYHLGLSYLKQNQRARAKEHLQKALQLNPKFNQADDARKTLEGLKG
ncbi:MAG: tetratricopeptide repeat protein, partial [Terriglobales bacterium]